MTDRTLDCWPGGSIPPHVTARVHQMGNICRTSEVFARVRPAVLPASARPSSALARRHRVSQFPPPPRHLSPRFPRRPGWLRLEPTRLRRGYRRLFRPRRVLGRLPAIKTIAPGGKEGGKDEGEEEDTLQRGPDHPITLTACELPAGQRPGLILGGLSKTQEPIRERSSARTMRVRGGSSLRWN